MSTPIPMPLRAVAGLAAVAIDEARRLPDRLVSFPVLAVSVALQASLKAQQHYADLVARGDQLLSQVRGPQEGTPPWARFDDEQGAPGSAGSAGPAFGDVAGVDILDTVDAVDSVQPVDIVDAADEPERVEVAEGADELAEAFGMNPEIALSDQLSAAQASAEQVAADALMEAAAVDALASDQALAAEAEAEAAKREAEQALDAATASRPEPNQARPEPTGQPDRPTAEEQIEALVDEPSAYDGYLATEPPLPDYDEFSLPQLRGKLRTLSERQLEELVAYERATADRAAFLTMLENRLSTVRGR